MQAHSTIGNTWEKCQCFQKFDILVMGRVVWHVLDLQLLSVVIFDKYDVAHPHIQYVPK